MNSTIKNKLFIGFSLMLILLAGTAIFMLTKLTETNNRLGNLVDISSQKIILSNEILISVLDEGRHEKNIILEPDLIKMGLFKDKIYESIANVDRKIPELRELLDDKGKKTLDEFQTSWEGYKPIIDQIVALALKYENDPAIKLSTNQGLKVRDHIIEQLRRLIEKNKASMQNDKSLSDKSYATSLNIIIALIVIGLLIAVIIAFWITRSITARISHISKEAEKIASREFLDYDVYDPVQDELRPMFNSLVNINKSFGQITGHAQQVASGNYDIEFDPKSARDTLGNALKKMTHSLREISAENEKHNWLATGQNQLSEKLRGDQGVDELATHTIIFLSNYIKANIGVIYLTDDQNSTLSLSGKYAFSSGQPIKQSFAFGEGLIGQAAVEQKPIFLNAGHGEPLLITSSAIDVVPAYILVYPFTFEGKTTGVIELGRLTAFTETEREFISSSLESIGISINSAIARKKIQRLLEETQVQAEELQTQQEEMRQLNEELEEQAQNLKQQQEELQITNEELEEQTQALEARNKEVEFAKFDIEQKTKQLELSSKYKSEFLANMSHELRTPLNSLLILSKDLAENRKHNLSDDQVESAEIIHRSGRDLLVLINEVLDLSKIEAGKMTLTVEKINLKNFITGLYKNFKFQTEQKNLRLDAKFGENLPEFIYSDSQRLDQVLKNIMSNAIKFTEKGQITISIENVGLENIGISIADTGIGIPEDQQANVFEAFQQADGGTSRKYGGTGLGLSISRELVKLLGGEIRLTSKVNEGSTFTLVIPAKIEQAITPEPVREMPAPKVHQKPNNQLYNYPTIDDDRDTIKTGDKVVLIIEDDLKFAAILLKQAHKKDFKALAAATGEDGLVLAERYKPHAIILDIDLPGIDGNQVLAELKNNPLLRHIPVHIASVNERSMSAIKGGAVEYFTKPIDKNQLEEAFNRMENFINRKMRNLLVVEDDENSRKAIKKLIGNGDVKTFEAGTGKEALSIFKEQHIDCIVLDIGLPDISGFSLIQQFEDIKGGAVPPIIVYTGRELTKEENSELQKYAETIIIKGVKSEERLLDETALFLHRTISNLPEPKQRIITNLYNKDASIASKKILLVDDDMRNVFALAKVLKEKGLEIIKAENGKVALEALANEPSVDLVLMDIMMPEMDGYETMRAIRAQPEFKALPIIALTAKAMKEDRQKCIDAGANDYIAKPVDVDRLMTLMRVWLSK